MGGVGVTHCKTGARVLRKHDLLGFESLFKAFQKVTKLIRWMGWLGIIFTVYKSDIHL